MPLPKLTVPTYKLNIPSTKEEIEYRPYLVGEEKLLMIADESESESVMLGSVIDIITRCVFSNIDIKLLKIYDIEYIFSQLKGKSIGERSDLMISCNKCKGNNHISVNIGTEVTVENLKKDGDKCNIKLSDDIGIVLKHLNILETIKFVESNENNSNTEELFSKILLCIDHIYQGDTIFDKNEQSEEELKEFLDGLNPDQFKLITDFIENMPEVVLKTSFKCVKCNKTNKIKLKGIENFF